MKIKTLTFSLTRKMPIPNVSFSNKEATFGMEIEVAEDEKVDKNKIWEELKQQVAIGLDEDPDWLKGGDDKK
jgi:hypothetical protein